jgi:hypothetical protein
MLREETVGERMCAERNSNAAKRIQPWIGDAKGQAGFTGQE